MRFSKIAVLLCCCLFAVNLCAQVKAGLWEVSTTMTYQKSPLPPGMADKMPNNPFSGKTFTNQVCYTAEQVAKYNAPVAEQKDCVLTNIQKLPNGMKAEMVCTGALSGKATVESSSTDATHSRSHMHFEGAMNAGRNGGGMPIEWTMDSTSTYKGADCGSVKPIQIPSK